MERSTSRALLEWEDRELGEESQSPKVQGYAPDDLACALSGCGLADVKSRVADAHNRLAAARKLGTAVVLCVIFIAVEVAGGLISRSLAVLTDAAHLLSDVAGFAISLFAIWASSWEATPRQSYGFFRLEILGALLSIQLIWLLTGIIVYEAIYRMIHADEQVNGRLMFFVATFGFFVNVIMVFLLGHHGHDHSDHGHDHVHGHDRVHDGEDHALHGHEHAHYGYDCAKEHTDDSSEQLLASVKGTNDCRHAFGNPERSHDHLHDHNHDHDHNESQLHGVTQGSRYAVHEIGRPGSFKVDIDINAGSSCKATSSKVSNINVKGAWLHVLGDLIQSIGVMIGGAIIWAKPEWKVVDLICTLFFSVVVLGTTIKILRDIMEVLMESTPREIDAKRLENGLCDVPGVIAVHDLHIWAITMGKTLLACHVTIYSDADADAVLQRVIGYCDQVFNISHVTFQIERQKRRPLS